MPTTLVEIFRDSETHHRLSLFDLPDLKIIEAGLVEKNGKPYLKCLATDKDRPAKPEEIVRQLWIHKLINQYGYSKSRLAIEHPVAFGSETKRADIVVFDKERVTVPYIMVELKKTSSKMAKTSSSPTAMPRVRPSASGRTASNTVFTIGKTRTISTTSLKSRRPPSR